jgi:hypothetical protein
MATVCAAGPGTRRQATAAQGLNVEPQLPRDSASSLSIMLVVKMLERALSRSGLCRCQEQA